MEPRPMAVRVGAAVGAVALAFGLPVLIVLLSVVSDTWRPLVGTLIVAMIAVSVAAWFLSRQRRPADSESQTPEAPT
jgi:lipopolysaccharide export LptBFGC system permease protein LptF